MIALSAAVALAASMPLAREAAMERCAEAALEAVRGPVGMADVTGTRFEWRSIAIKGADWVIIGSLIDAPDAKNERVAHRFQCTTRGTRTPRVKLLRVVRF